MRMTAAARHFHQTQAYDGYTLAPVFKCHLSNFDDSSSDGSTARRRALHLAPDAVVPTRRAVQINGETWLVGGSNADSYHDELMRRSYGMKKATDLAAILSPAAACEGAVGTSSYIHKHYFREVTNPQNDSDIDTMWNVFLAPGETVGEGSFFRLADRLLRVRNVYLPVEGLRVAQSDQLDADARVQVTFISDTYIPEEDTTLSKAVQVWAIRMEYSKLYKNEILPESRSEAGDMSLLVAKSALTPKVGDKLRMSDRLWRVTKLDTELDAWLMKVERA